MMQRNKGALLIARNNGQLDYVKQAAFLAIRIKKYLDIPVSIITDSVEYLKTSYDELLFDKIIEVPYNNNNNNTRAFFDGTLSYKLANFKNKTRSKCFELSPYEETLILDTDYIISNDTLNMCFKSDSNLMMFKESQDIANVRDPREFKYISDTSIDFYWATVIFFRKTEINKIFFDLIDYIEQEWEHFRNIYQVNSSLFRNDFAFSIAVHIMNGFENEDFVTPLPGKHLYTTDKDVLCKIQDGEMTFLVEKEKFLGEYTLVSTKDQNIHVMNKFSLERNINV